MLPAEGRRPLELRRRRMCTEPTPDVGQPAQTEVVEGWKALVAEVWRWMETVLVGIP